MIKKTLISCSFLWLLYHSQVLGFGPGQDLSVNSDKDQLSTQAHQTDALAPKKPGPRGSARKARIRAANNSGDHLSESAANNSGNQISESAANQALQNLGQFLEAKLNKNLSRSAENTLVASAAGLAVLSSISSFHLAGEFAKTSVADFLHLSSPQEREALAKAFAVLAGISAIAIASNNAKIYLGELFLSPSQRKISAHTWVQLDKSKLANIALSMTGASTAGYLVYKGFPNLPGGWQTILGALASLRPALSLYHSLNKASLAQLNNDLLKSEASSDANKRRILNQRFHDIYIQATNLSHSDTNKLISEINNLDTVSALFYINNNILNTEVSTGCVHHKAYFVCDRLGDLTAIFLVYFISLPLAKDTWDLYSSNNWYNLVPIDGSSIIATIVGYTWFILLRNLFAERYADLYNILTLSQSCSPGARIKQERIGEKIIYNSIGLGLAIFSSAAMAEVAHIVSPNWPDWIANQSTEIIVSIWFIYGFSQSGELANSIASATNWAREQVSPESKAQREFKKNLYEISKLIPSLKIDIINSLYDRIYEQ